MNMPEIHTRAKEMLLTEVKRLKREKGMNTLDAQREAARIVSSKLKAEKAEHPAAAFCRAHRDEMASLSEQKCQMISALCTAQADSPTQKLPR